MVPPECLEYLPHGINCKVQLYYAIREHCLHCVMQIGRAIKLFFCRIRGSYSSLFRVVKLFQRHGLLATSCAGVMNGPLVLCDQVEEPICLMKERDLDSDRHRNQVSQVLTVALTRASLIPPVIVTSSV